jgi:hypothetical protein
MKKNNAALTTVTVELLSREPLPIKRRKNKT